MRRLSIEFSMCLIRVNDNANTCQFCKTYNKRKQVVKLKRSQISVFACMYMYASLGFKDAKKSYARYSDSFVLKMLLICL
jgi:hypothetical protein